MNNNENMKKELEYQGSHEIPANAVPKSRWKLFYDFNDLEVINNFSIPKKPKFLAMQTLDDLLEKDKLREKDGFPRKIRLGKLMRPVKGKNPIVVVVPTTTESKFYHDESVTEEDSGQTGGSGEGEEGDVLGEQKAEPEEGEGTGAGQGNGESHDVSEGAFDLGRILTEKFSLPRLQNKGRKHSFSKYIYDLTDRNRGFGQILDKKATLKKVVETNILLGNISQNKDFEPENLVLSPKDHVYQILSKEKDFESEAIVFFLRDYSGSMEGNPTEVISTQHLFIYSWLMFQYQNNVKTRFILHDTEAKEVPDFYTYIKSQVAGGTKVAPAFELVNKIVAAENLAKDYNIYVFHGTDGDDWDNDGKELLESINKMFLYTNRIGITVAKTTGGITTVERNIEKSGFLKEKSSLIKMDSVDANSADETRIIDGIRKLVE